MGDLYGKDGWLCPHCGERVEIFPRSQEARNALDELPLLGRIPLDPKAVVSGDKGQPMVVSMPESLVAQAFTAMTERIVAIVETKQAAETQAEQREERLKGEQTDDERED